MKIVFVSEMRNPNTNASSTQIMTKNLLYGFRQICEHVIFVPIIENKKDQTPIENAYSSLCDEIIFVHSLTKPHAKPLPMIVSSMKALIHFSIRKIPKKLFCVDNYILVSHSPSIDSVLICNIIKKRCKIKSFIEYWGDPYALSLITPEEFYYKRIPDKIIEKKLLSFSDSIVYGTKSLFDAQTTLYPHIIDKSFYVNVPYSPDSMNSSFRKRKIRIGYFGNYYSFIRDIIPFYEASLIIDNADITICGSGDIHLTESANLKVLERVSQSEVVNLEKEIDIVVCLLNKKGFQIPGKVFYQTNTNKDILVILDGPQKDKIFEELNKSNRFIFCDNNKDSILNALRSIINNRGEKDYDSKMYSPKRICREILEVGVTKCGRSLND